MPNAIVMTGYGPPEVLRCAQVPVPEAVEGQIRIKVKAAGISPTDLALRAGYLKDAIPLPANAVLGFEAAGTVDAVGPGVTGSPSATPSRRCCSASAVTPSMRSRRSGPASRIPFRGSSRGIARLCRGSHGGPSAAGRQERRDDAAIRRRRIRRHHRDSACSGPRDQGDQRRRPARRHALARELEATPVRYGSGLPGPGTRRAQWTPCSTPPERAS